jgi:hypothetical protein
LSAGVGRGRIEAHHLERRRAQKRRRNHVVDERSLQRDGSSPLARYCSEPGLLPPDIDDQTVAVYGQDLISKSLLDRPKQAHRTTCIAWNRATDTVAGWPQQKLTIPNSRPTYTLSPAAFPASFGIDLYAYLAHLRGDDLFGEMGGQPASPDTLIGRRKQIMALASALL